MNEILNILLVEDEPIWVNFIEGLLPKDKYAITSFSNAEDAIKAYEDKFFPIIITDIGLPEMDGLEFCRYIRKHPKGNDSIIIVMTGVIEPDSLNLVLDAGADDYLPKPVDFELFNIRLEIAAKQAQNILEKQKTKTAFKESEKKLWGILTSLTDTVIIVFDSNSDNIFSWSDVLLDNRYGIKIDGGETLISELSAFIKANYLLSLQNVFATGETITKNFDFDFPNGKFYFRLNFSPMFGDKGDICSVVTFIRDVSREMEAKKNLQEQINFLQNLIDAIPNPIFYKDEKLKYQGCNKAFEKYLGKKREQIIGKTVFDIAPPELAQKYYEKDRELIKNKGQQTYEWFAQSPDGGQKSVIFHKATFLKADGNIGGIVGIVQDISEKKKLQEQLEECQKELAKYQ